MTLFMLFVSGAYAACPGGELLINPHGSYYPLPIILSSPATFTIESINSTTGIFPNIVLVMSKASFDGLTGPVIVEWTGTSGQSNQSIFPKPSFQAATNGFVPDQTVTPFDSGRYNVSKLKERLGVNRRKRNRTDTERIHRDSALNPPKNARLGRRQVRGMHTILQHANKPKRTRIHSPRTSSNIPNNSINRSYRLVCSEAQETIVQESQLAFFLFFISHPLKDKKALMKQLFHNAGATSEPEENRARRRQQTQTRYFLRSFTRKKPRGEGESDKFDLKNTNRPIDVLDQTRFEPNFMFDI
jgi:hypothetical protein